MSTQQLTLLLAASILFVSWNKKEDIKFVVGSSPHVSILHPPDNVVRVSLNDTLDVVIYHKGIDSVKVNGVVTPLNF